MHTPYSSVVPAKMQDLRRSPSFTKSSIVQYCILNEYSVWTSHAGHRNKPTFYNRTSTFQDHRAVELRKKNQENKRGQQWWQKEDKDESRSKPNRDLATNQFLWKWIACTCKCVSQDRNDLEELSQSVGCLQKRFSARNLLSFCSPLLKCGRFSVQQMVRCSLPG